MGARVMYTSPHTGETEVGVVIQQVSSGVVLVLLDTGEYIPAALEEVTRLF